MYSQVAAVAELTEAREQQRLDARKKRLAFENWRVQRREAAFVRDASAPCEAVRDARGRNAPTGLQLRRYQETAVAKAVAENAASWRRLLVLATGAGKTVIAAEILNRVLRAGGRALFVAHRDELLSQAKAEIEGFVP